VSNFMDFTDKLSRDKRGLCIAIHSPYKEIHELRTITLSDMDCTELTTGWFRSDRRSAKSVRADIISMQESVRSLRDYIKARTSKLEEHISFMDNLKQGLETGRLILLEAEPLVFPNFAQVDIERCTTLIVKEIENGEQLSPSDIAEKYDIDYMLVSYCFDQLAKDGKIEEVRK